MRGCARANSSKVQYPGKQIVGWYHTHLVSIASSPTQPRQPYKLPNCFSRIMTVLCTASFSADPWYVAMVLGPQGNAAFFRWFGDKISSNRRFYVFRPD